jgi:ATP-binding cassette subfamily F protein 3
MRAKDVLLEALQGFSGTVVFVSHDRYFIDKLATRIFEVGEGAVHIFPGNYEDYLWRKQGGAPAGPPPESAPAADEKPAAVARPAAPAGPKPAAGDRRLNPIKLRQMKQRRHAIEDEVTRLEVEIGDFERALANFRSAEETVQLTELLQARRADLQSLLAEWEQVAQAIEANR